MRYQQLIEVDGKNVKTVGFIPMDKEEPLEDGAHPWRSADWLQLRSVVLGFLSEMYANEKGDIRPTNENVDILINIGITRAEAGDPCFAMWKDGVIIGFTLWVGCAALHPSLELREKICSGLGTYIMKDHRQQGHSKTLREAAFTCAKEAGYARVDGSAYDKLGYQTATKFGAKSMSLVISRRL